MYWCPRYQKYVSIIREIGPWIQGTGSNMDRTTTITCFDCKGHIETVKEYQ